MKWICSEKRHCLFICEKTGKIRYRKSRFSSNCRGCWFLKTFPKKKFIGTKKCEKDELNICDFCIHFLMFKTQNGGNLDGSGYRGLKRNNVDAGDGCKNFYCLSQWKINMKLHFPTRKELEKK